MAVKLKRSRKHEDGTATKKSRNEEEMKSTLAVDRLTDLPNCLQVQILSSLETRYVVQTSMLSKSWASSTWTCVPVLTFSSIGFSKLHDFDNFVYNTLSRRGSIKLDKLTFYRDGTISAKILEKVFDYAFSHGVKEFKVGITGSRFKQTWPMCPSSDSLTSLMLESEYNNIGCCSFLGGSGSFKNLANLHLKRAIIADLDPFSGFPALEKLVLDNCRVETNEKTLNIHALMLSELTIKYYNPYVNCCQLTTPKLKHFECAGNNFPRLKTHQGGLPVLDTLLIDYNGSSQEEIMFDGLLMLFSSCYNAKSLTLCPYVIHLLSLFPDELVNRCSPFRYLKSLKLDFCYFYNQKLFGDMEGSLKRLLGVRAYFLEKSYDAECTMICPKDPDSPWSHSSGSQPTCLCVHINTI